MQAKRRVRVHSSSPSSSHLHGGGEGAQRGRRTENPRPATSSGSQSASFAWAGVVGADIIYTVQTAIRYRESVELSTILYDQSNGGNSTQEIYKNRHSAQANPSQTAARNNSISTRPKGPQTTSQPTQSNTTNHTMSFRSNPLSACPTRALALQQYLLLHSEHESLRLSLATYPIDTLSSYPASTYPSTPYSVATAAAYDADARKLHDVNQQIKSALTELLN
ncbi:hypothetical protein V501_05718, partial [Pseudogymnoascus sp. VKM F-4519 (FW-2642)]